MKTFIKKFVKMGGLNETFTTFKQNDREIKAKDKLMNPYKFDIEKFIYQMFLAGSTINYEEAKAL